MAELTDKFGKINRFVEGTDTAVVITGGAPGFGITGLEKSTGQTGLFVHTGGDACSVHFYNTDTNAWELYGSVSAGVDTITLQWASNHSAVAFSTSVTGHTFRIMGLDGDIIIDSDLTDGIDSEGDTLIVSGTSFALTATQLAAGVAGPAGPTGPAGATGATGAAGATGPAGSTDMGGTMTDHIIPDTNAAYDLGNAEYKIRHLYLSNNSMYIGDTWIKAEGDQIKTPNLLVGDINLNNEGRQNEVDGTSGHWSIQEGSNDLFLINRNTGKKYKFNLTEM